MQDIFRRREKKYLITTEQGKALQRLIRRHAEIDRQGEYLVHDLYYDTDDWDIVRTLIEKPLFKEKLRLRFYGGCESGSYGFLEMKRKCDSTVYKRRIAIPSDELKNRGVREIVSELDSQIAREIKYYLRTNPVSERIHITYKRIAYTGIKDEGLRVTFDKGIAFHLCSLNNNNLWEYNPDDYYGGQILDDNQVLMEIKTMGAIPLWLVGALSENRLYPVSFSKFGVSYAKYISKWQSFEGVKNAA
jgi:SPX domain protein involved in polyphosphate accumulation